MTPAAMIAAARKDGVILTLCSPDTIKLAGARLTVKRWMPLIRQNKPAILAVLREEVAAGGGIADDIPPHSLAVRNAHVREPVLMPLLGNNVLGEDDLKRGLDGGTSDRANVSSGAAQTLLGYEDERRYCMQCWNLMANGRCAAAARGELNTMRIFYPIQGILQRCAGYLPTPDDHDQRTGRERRWPA